MIILINTSLKFGRKEIKALKMDSSTPLDFLCGPLQHHWLFQTLQKYLRTPITLNNPNFLRYSNHLTPKYLKNPIYNSHITINNFHCHPKIIESNIFKEVESINNYVLFGVIYLNFRVDLYYIIYSHVISFTVACTFNVLV